MWLHVHCVPGKLAGLEFLVAEQWRLSSVDVLLNHAMELFLFFYRSTETEAIEFCCDAGTTFALLIAKDVGGGLAIEPTGHKR